MSSSRQEGSVRQLPPGKLSDIKKLFEDGSTGNSGKTDKPVPPARPAALPNRIKSPVPQQPLGQVQQRVSLLQKQQQTSLTSKSAEESSTIGSEGSYCKTVPPEQSPAKKEMSKPSSSVSRKVSSCSYYDDQSDFIETESIHPRSLARHLQDESVTVDNTLKKSAADCNDLYSKVIKPAKQAEDSPRKVMFSHQETSNHKRENVGKQSGERRNTVASFPNENNESRVSVALRTKMFDKQKVDKPALPLKPDPVKRQFSMRTCKELEQEQQKLLPENRSECRPDQEAIYDPPWDSSRNAVLEKLKKGQLQSLVEKSSSIVKVSASPKPAWKKSDLAPDSKQMKTNLQETVSDAPQMKAAPPPKPPRTHAHDQYLQVKIPQNVDTGSSELASSTKKVSLVESSNTGEVTQEVTECLSVKDRISKMQHHNDSASTSFSNKEQTVVMRHQPPSRPPPPKRRPNSGGNPLVVPQLPYPRPLTQAPKSQNDGPVIIPVSPRSKWPPGKQITNWQDMKSRHPNDQLPPEPDFGKPLQRFPLRKSFSSECLHSSRGSSLNIEIEDADLASSMTQSSYEYQYEAVIDADGYAVPHEFMRLPGRKKHSVQIDGTEDVTPTKFLTRIEGFSGESLASQDAGSRQLQVTATKDQNLEKVNKNKMIMVRHKINQAYADVELGDASADKEWTIVDRQDALESVVEPTELKRRVDYCTSVRLKSSKTIKRSKEYLNAIYPQLFEYCLLVGLKQLVYASGYEPYVIHKFPENVSSNLSVPNFCFPDASIFKPGSASSVSEAYSFVMTYADGSRVYGYCRRLQPQDASLPEVICIISPIDAFNMYNILLNEIETKRRISTDLALELIAASFGRPLPKPGKVCSIRTLDANGDMETIFLTRQSDSRLHNVNYESPLHSLGTDKLVQVFSSMLMEKRIMLCSSHLSVLTQTVHALSALLYPFQWQHVYIPLLPGEMLDVVCAPMPYIVGVLTEFLPRVRRMDIEEVFILDLDKKSIVLCEGDESNILPRKIQRALKTAINMCKIDSEACNAQWLIVAEAFLRVFIETIGHFHNHIQTQQDGNRIFQKEGFILDAVSKELRQFLEWFTETQMFEVFIVNHVENSDYSTNSLFMQRLTEFRESKEESSRHKGLGAKVKNFGKALKTKLQPSS